MTILLNIVIYYFKMGNFVCGLNDLSDTHYEGQRAIRKKLSPPGYYYGRVPGGGEFVIQPAYKAPESSVPKKPISSQINNTITPHIN